MGYTLAEEAVFGGNLIKVRIKMVAANAAKINNVSFGDGSSMGHQSLTNHQFFEVLLEGMYLGGVLTRAGVILIGDGH